MRQNDPFELAYKALVRFQTDQQLFFIAPGEAVIAKVLSTFKGARQKPSSLDIDDVVEKVTAGTSSGGRKR